MKNIKVELIIQIKDDGEIVVLAYPEWIGKPAVMKSSDVKPQPQATQTAQIPQTQPQSNSQTSKKSKTQSKSKSKRSFLVMRIKQLSEQYPGLKEYLKQVNIDIDNLDDLTDKQIRRAMALALNYAQSSTKQDDIEL